MAASIFLSQARIHSLEDLALGGVAYSEAATLYAVRYTTCPDNADAGGAIDTNFAPVAFSNDATFWNSATSQVKTNAGTLIWAAYSGGGSTHAGWGIYDHATLRGASHLVAVVKFATAVTVLAGQSPYVAPGAFSYTLKNTGSAFFFGNYLINKLLNVEFGGIAFTPAATLTQKAYTANPVAAGSGGTEATYTGYTTMSVANNLTTWTAAAARAKKNAIGLPHPVGTSTQTLTGFAWWDGANLYAVHVASVTIASGQGPVIPAGFVNCVWSAS